MSFFKKHWFSLLLLAIFGYLAYKLVNALSAAANGAQAAGQALLNASNIANPNAWAQAIQTDVSKLWSWFSSLFSGGNSSSSSSNMIATTSDPAITAGEAAGNSLAAADGFIQPYTLPDNATSPTSN